MHHPGCFLLLNSIFYFSTVAVLSFILKSSVCGRETAKLLPDVSQPCLCLAYFCTVPKNIGVGNPGVAPIFSPASSA